MPDDIQGGLLGLLIGSILVIVFIMHDHKERIESLESYHVEKVSKYESFPDLSYLYCQTDRSVMPENIKEVCDE